MSPYQPNQEFANIHWGTMMPIAAMVNSTFVQLRARGSFSAIVVDPAQLADKESDPENIESYLRSLVVNTITEIIGGLSSSATDITQITTVTDSTMETLQSLLESKFSAIGLKLQNVSIEAIESL